MNQEPKILLVKGEMPSALAMVWERELPCEKIDYNLSVGAAFRRQNLQEYNVLVIDASDNLPVGDFENFTSYVRSKNKKIFIIGTSIQGEYFKKDDLIRKIYDSCLSASFLSLPENIEMLRDEMQEVGFVFGGKK